jgi:hypothetical protein
VFLTPVFYTAIRRLTDRSPVVTETPVRSVPVHAVREDLRAVGRGSR